MNKAQTYKQEIEEDLKNGVQFSNDTSDFYAFLRNDGQKVFYLRGEYRTYKSIGTMAQAVARVLNKGI